jgi:pimeloyl-ACP methyl ester carboxylesterase
VAETLLLPDGRLVAYETYGDPGGASLVLLHGFSDSRLTGEVFAPAAERQSVRLLVPDRPGIGLSTGRLRSLAECGSWLAAFLDALGLERVPLAAISGGGPFALACAYAVPERLERVLVVSGLGPPELGTAGMPRGQRLGIAVARRAPRLGAAVMGGVALLGRAWPRLFLALVGANTGSTDAAAVRSSGSERTIVAPFLEAYRQGSRGVGDELRLLLRPWGFRVEEIRVPVRFEHGDGDVTVPPAAARQLSGRIPGAELRIRAGAGHFTLAPRHADELLAFARE